jgi:hypothetical protein
VIGGRDPLFQAELGAVGGRDPLFQAQLAPHASPTVRSKLNLDLRRCVRPRAWDRREGTGESRVARKSIRPTQPARRRLDN